MIINFLLVILIFGVLFWAVNQLPFIIEPAKTIINVVLVVLLIVYCVGLLFGVGPSIGVIR